MYCFKCILPNDRIVYYNNNNFQLQTQQQQQIQQENSSFSTFSTYNRNILIILQTNEQQKEQKEEEQKEGQEENHKNIMLLNLGEYFNFHYTSYLQFLHESLLRNYIYWGLDEQSSLPIIENNIDNDNSNSNSELQRKLICGEISEKIYLRQIGYVNNIDVGYGVYASEIINSNKFIGEYTGVIMESTFGTENSNYSLNYPSADKSFLIDASEFGNIIRFVNHSSKPNTEFRSVLHQGIVHVLCVC